MLLDVPMSALLFSVLDLCSIYQILPGLSVNTSYSKRIYLTSLSLGFLVRYRWLNSLCANVFVHQRMDYRPLSQGTQRQFMVVFIRDYKSSELRERERGPPCQADTSPLRWTSPIRWFSLNFVQ